MNTGNRLSTSDVSLVSKIAGATAIEHNRAHQSETMSAASPRRSAWPFALASALGYVGHLRLTVDAMHSIYGIRIKCALNYERKPVRSIGKPGGFDITGSFDHPIDFTLVVFEREGKSWTFTGVYPALIERDQEGGIRFRDRDSWHQLRFHVLPPTSLAACAFRSSKDCPERVNIGLRHLPGTKFPVDTFLGPAIADTVRVRPTSIDAP